MEYPVERCIIRFDINVQVIISHVTPILKLRAKRVISDAEDVEVHQ